MSIGCVGFPSFSHSNFSIFILYPSLLSDFLYLSFFSPILVFLYHNLSVSPSLSFSPSASLLTYLWTAPKFHLPLSGAINVVFVLLSITLCLCLFFSVCLSVSLFFSFSLFVSLFLFSFLFHIIMESFSGSLSLALFVSPLTYLWTAPNSLHSLSLVQ